MSIIICKYCEQHVDTDFNAEHEEECFLEYAQEAYKESDVYEEYIEYLQAKVGEKLNEEEEEWALIGYNELISNSK